MTKLHQTEKQPQRGEISSLGCSVAKPLVRNARLGFVLAAEPAEEASLFRQNPVPFGFAFSRLTNSKATNYPFHCRFAYIWTMNYQDYLEIRPDKRFGKPCFIISGNDLQGRKEHVISYACFFD